jgi:hypothetical protein
MKATSNASKAKKNGATVPAHGERFSGANTDANAVLLEYSWCWEKRRVLAQMPPKAIDRKYQSKRRLASQMLTLNADAVTTNASHDGGLLNSP